LAPFCPEKQGFAPLKKTGKHESFRLIVGSLSALGVVLPVFHGLISAKLHGKTSGRQLANQTA